LRKFTLLVSVAAAIATCAVVFGAGVAGADPGNGNGASVYKDFGCTLFDGNGGFVFVATGTHSVEITNGNAVTICKASGVPNSTGKAAHWDNSNTGDFCFIAGGLTTDWNETVSASGEATLRCHVNGSS
jgi:hypothetical protein